MKKIKMYHICLVADLSITCAFPCRYSGKDKSAAAAVEAEIARTMEWKRVTLVGWYHSHPRSHASPSLRDVDSQLDYQIKMKGPSDNGYTPCVGLICCERHKGFLYRARICMEAEGSLSPVLQHLITWMAIVTNRISMSFGLCRRMRIDLTNILVLCFLAIHYHRSIFSPRTLWKRL